MSIHATKSMFALGLIGAMTLLPAAASARVCTGETNGRLEEMKTQLQNYKSDPLGFHELRIEFESTVVRNCSSPVKEYAASNEYASLTKQAYAEAAKAAAKKAADLRSYAGSDDKNLARFLALEQQLESSMAYGGVTREQVLRDAGVSEKQLLAAQKAAQVADLPMLMKRVARAEEILKMESKENAASRREIRGRGNSAEELVGRLSEARWANDGQLPDDLKKQLKSFPDERLVKIIALERCREGKGVPDYLNCADALARRINKEVAATFERAKSTSSYEQKGESKLNEVLKSRSATSVR